MNPPNVHREVSAGVAAKVAEMTLERFILGVDQLVTLEVYLGLELFATNVTPVPGHRIIWG